MSSSALGGAVSSPGFRTRLGEVILGIAGSRRLLQAYTTQRIAQNPRVFERLKHSHLDLIAAAP